MIFWIHEDRCGPDGTRIVKIMPFPWATGNFVIVSFSHVFKTSRLFLALCFACARGPQRPVDVPKYYVLRRQRSHVFLTLRFAQREDQDGSPFIRGLCSAQAGEQDFHGRTTTDVAKC